MKGAVAVVFEEMAGGRLALEGSLRGGCCSRGRCRSSHRGRSRRRLRRGHGFEQVSAPVLASVDGAGVEAGLFRDVDEADAERVPATGDGRALGAGRAGALYSGRAGFLAHGAGLRLLLRAG